MGRFRDYYVVATQADATVGRLGSWGWVDHLYRFSDRVIKTLTS